MTPTMRVRGLTAAERNALRRGLKAADGFTVRRCQALLASADGAGPAAIGAVEGMRGGLARLGIGWKRAKHWITSPDPDYAKKKSDGTD